MNKTTCKLTLGIALTACSLSEAQASVTSSGTLPFESYLVNISNAFSGPIASAIAIIGITASGATLIFNGGEIGKLFRSMVGIVLVVGFMMGAKYFVTNVFNGADIGDLKDCAVSEDNSKIAAKREPLQKLTETMTDSFLETSERQSQIPGRQDLNSPYINSSHHSSDLKYRKLTV